MLSDLRYRLRALFRRNAMERELDAELHFHLERETEKYVRQGIPRADARRRARIKFGGLDRIKDDTRDARGISLIETALQDLRYAGRGLRSKPGFTLAVVATLGLGIGANTAMFGIVDRMLFRPPAYLVDADKVHRVYFSWIAPRGDERTERNFSYLRFLEIDRGTTSFDRVAPVRYRELAVGTGEGAREMPIGAVGASFFDFFDARPALGRFFVADEDRTPRGAAVVVLGYNLWQTRYGGSTSVLGTQLQIGNQSYTIIGVAPEGFAGMPEAANPAAFVPITTFAAERGTDYYTSHNWSWLEVIVHRKPGVSVAAANSDLTATHVKSWNTQRGTSNRGLPADSAKPRGLAGSVHLARGPQAGTEARVVTWVMGVAGIVLLVACANVANLLLARALARRREIALRLALGVTRRRLLQQLLTESVLLAAVGGVVGLAIAQWGGRALRALLLPAEDTAAVVGDSRTLLFVTAVTIGVALITGLAPAIHALREDVSDSLKAGLREGTHRRSRLRSGLLLFQAALCVVLLVGAGLFVRSLSNVRSMPLGYDVEPIVYVEGNLRGAQLSAAEQNGLADRLVEAAATTPGVQSATLTISVPFWSFEGRGGPSGPNVDSVGKVNRFNLQAGGPTYFATTGTRIVRGRGILPEDRAGSLPVVIVNEAMAKTVWPGRDAIGQLVRFGNDTLPYMTVVGIAENIWAGRLTGNPAFWYYMPLEQYKVRYGPASAAVYARVNGKAEDYVEALRRRLQGEMPGAGYVNAVPLDRMISRQQRSWAFGATMFVAFGGLALLLAAIGLYGVIAYGVAQRTHELGVRIALGASTGNVVRMVVKDGVVFAVAGIAIGSVLALWAGKWVEPLLFSQSARDPWVFGAVAFILLLVAIGATLRPALRATRVDPTVALRAE